MCHGQPAIGGKPATANHHCANHHCVEDGHPGLPQLLVRSASQVHGLDSITVKLWCESPAMATLYAASSHVAMRLLPIAPPDQPWLLKANTNPAAKA